MVWNCFLKPSYLYSLKNLLRICSCPEYGQFNLIFAVGKDMISWSEYPGGYEVGTRRRDEGCAEGPLPLPAAVRATSWAGDTPWPIAVTAASSCGCTHVVHADGIFWVEPPSQHASLTLQSLQAQVLLRVLLASTGPPWAQGTRLKLLDPEQRKLSWKAAPASRYLQFAHARLLGLSSSFICVTCEQPVFPCGSY